eukprot:XP_001697937.1 predicted protein [Chlamydomonas reinhardtii]
MASSVLLGTRPDWTRSTLGIPIDTIVRIHPGAVGAKPDLAFSRNRVSVSRVPGAAAKPEDEFDVGYVYGPEASNADVAGRSLLPLLRKFVDGYNVAVMAFGATGTGKTLLLEGSRGKERHSSEGNGLVHIAIDELFKLLNEKAVAVGNAVAERRRMPSARAFDFFLETSYVEVYREEVHDLFARPTGGNRAPLQIYEDVTEGYQVSGLAYRIAKTSTEMRTAFNNGRMQRDTTKEDVGAVHERSAAIFTIHLAQYSPAAVAGEEDRIMVSKIQFVDLPDALGGNALCLMAGTLRQADGSNGLHAINTLQYLTIARSGRNFPIINHGRARGLIQKLRQRLMAVVDDRQALRELMEGTPAEGDPNAMAINIAKLRDLEARLMAVRGENAELMEEKHALQARLQKLYQAEEGDLQEKSELQAEAQGMEASIAAEELARISGEKEALVIKLRELEQLLADRTAGLESQLQQETGALQKQLAEETTALEKRLADETAAKQAELEALRKEADDLRAEVARLTEGLRQLAAGETEAAEGGPVDELVHAQDAVAKAKEAVEKRRAASDELKEKVSGCVYRGWELPALCLQEVRLAYSF